MKSRFVWRRCGEDELVEKVACSRLPMMSTVTRNSKNRKREGDNYIKTVHQEKGSKRNTDMNVQLRSTKIKS